MLGNKCFKATSIILLLICLSFFLPSTIFSATYYIDYNAGNDSNTSLQAQSQLTPWKHMPGMSGCIKSCALYSVRTGDVFVLKGGATWTITSTTADLITLKVSGIIIRGGQRLETPWGSGYPVLDGSGCTTSRVGINGTNKSVVVDGIKIVNMGYARDNNRGFGIALDGGDIIEIKNCWLETSAIEAIHVGMASGSVNHLWIHDNHFKNNGRTVIGQGSGDSANSINDIKIYNNLYEGPGQVNYGVYHTDGFMIQANNKKDYGIKNLKIFNNKFYGDWSQGGTAMIFLSGCNFDEQGICKGDNGRYSTQNVEIYNNVVSFENNVWSGGTGPNISPALVDIQAGSHENIKIYNNTISSSATAVPVSNCIFAGVPINGLKIKNNIISGCVNGITLGQNITELEIDYNLYNITAGFHRFINGWPGHGSADCRNLTDCRAAPFYSEAHGKSGDPLFAALPSGGVSGSGNWSLQPNSPAISAGADLSAFFTTDFLGSTRSGKWDIGAYKRKN